ncbi:peptide ABC transporter substrate-binding protein [Brevibacillus sp. SYSU BS000544]|uniref:peptide ABC transporter substrate-binding protein n=1 Tax=Brevibacillus sp. SYSU BS000544 TaxID=3416443 RepID=UPI003CE4D511
MRKFFNTVLVCTLALGLLVTGCSSNTTAPPAKTDQAGTPQETPKGNKFVRYNSGEEPKSLDPSIGYDEPSWVVVYNMFEGLTRLDKDENPIAGVAKEWKVSPDGKVYTFTLRDDAKWSNGEAITADDFVYAWKHMLDPKTASESAFLAYGIKGAEDFNSGKGSPDALGVKAVDAKTLEVTLTQPAPWFLGLLTVPTFYPINKAAAEKDPKWFAEAATIISNGPFKITDWKHDAEIKLEKNEHYWDASSVKIDGVIFKMVKDSNTAYQLYQSGELEISEIPSDLSDQLFAEGKVNVGDSAGLEFYRLNTSKPPFSNVNIRKAFNMAIDRQKLVDLVQRRKQKPAVGLISYGFNDPAGGQFRDVGGAFVTYDPAEAKKLLETGMAELGLTQLPEITIEFNTSDTHQKNAEAVQEMLKSALGVEVKLANMERQVLSDKQKKLDYHISRSSWIPDFADPINTLEIMLSESSSNRTGWKNAKFDQLIKDAYVELDNAKRYQMMHEAEKIFMEDAPIIPLYFYNSTNLQKDNLTGVLRPVFGYVNFKHAELK